jgi:mono/diheme cytochrome c family protein
MGGLRDGADAAQGKAKFDHTCATCHGAGVGDDGRAMLPGTDALRIKYQGSLSALLEQRTGLNADAIRTFVRRGTWSMPPFRPTEVTERDIQDIAVYLRQSSGAALAAPASIEGLAMTSRRALLLFAAVAPSAFVAWRDVVAAATDLPGATIASLQQALVAASRDRSNTTVDERYRTLELIIVERLTTCRTSPSLRCAGSGAR